MRTLDLTEAAAFVHLHPHTLEAKARAGEVPGAKPGKCWVFIDDDLVQWLRGMYRGATCHSTSVEASGGAHGSSTASAFEKRLPPTTGKPRRNTTTAAVLKFGDKLP